MAADDENTIEKSMLLKDPKKKKIKSFINH